MSKLSLLCLCATLATACGSSTREPEVASSPAAPAANAPESQPAQAAVTAPGAALKIGDKTKCPVSGEEFVVAENSPKVTHEGKDYYLCCASCAEEFKADPKKFAK